MYGGYDIGFATFSSQFEEGEKKFHFHENCLQLVDDIEELKFTNPQIKKIPFHVNGYPVLNLPNHTYPYKKFIGKG